jgi:hypothetical protein
MAKKHYVKLDHEPVSEDYHTNFADFFEWLDSHLIYSEELGKARGYFDAKSPYMETYRRQLTPRQAVMRQAYAPMALEERELEEEEGVDISEEEDFGL